MSLFIYAGAMQYVAVGLLTQGASLVTFALTTLMVNVRHIFYGLSMLDDYKNTGAAKPYLIFGLTDETYSLVCNCKDIKDKKEKTKYFWAVTMLDQSYWIIGTVAGSIIGSALDINFKGIDFSLTALFITVFTDQWLKSKNHAAAIVGVAASVVMLILFGRDNFLIPTMCLIAATLLMMKPICMKGVETDDNK